MELSEIIKAKANLIEAGAAAESNAVIPPSYHLSIACALLTSPIKAEREQGKQMIRDWRFPNNKKPA